MKMPIGDDYARLPEWKPGTPRLKGYPIRPSSNRNSLFADDGNYRRVHSLGSTSVRGDVGRINRAATYRC